MSALDEVRDEAVLGSYCPKMCNFACPVAAATGQEADTPWGLHVTVAALAGGRREPDARSYRDLTGCTGCHACRDACLYDLDVPAQVRAARAHHEPVDDPAVARVLTEVEEGRTPYGEPPLDLDVRNGSADLQVILGCRDDDGVAEAVDTLFSSSGLAVQLVAPDGCCGAVLTDLGLTRRGRELGQSLAGRLAPDTPTAVVDPHCLPVVRAIVDAAVQDSLTMLVNLLEEGRLQLGGARGRAITYHDPCLLARDGSTVDAPRRLLDAAGYRIEEPIAHARRTTCSGAGMAMDLLDPGAAGAVAGRRAQQLGERGCDVATACSRARAVLTSAGTPADDIHVVLAHHVGGPAR